MTAALVPAQIITGRVTYADTGKPVPHAQLEVISSQGQGRHPRRIRDRRRGTVPRESAAGRPLLQRHGLSSRQGSPTSSSPSVSSGPRARSSSPSTSPCPAAS